MVFVDESGKSGTIRLEKGSWNDNGAPYFVMAAVIIPDSKLSLLDAKIDSIMRNYRINGKELKSTYKQVKKSQQNILDDLAEFLVSVNGCVLSEVSNKKFNICMTITDYCALPYYDVPIEQAFSQEEIMIKMIFANFFAERLSNELLGKTVEFFDSDSHDVIGLVDLCREIIAAVDDGSRASAQVISSIEETIDTIEHHTERGLEVRHLFPIPDSYNGGKTSIAVSPQINCLNNLLTRACQMGEYTYKLDKMYDLAASIMQNADIHGKLSGIKPIINFCDSKNEKGIQVADFLAGTIRQYVEDIQNTENSRIRLPSFIRDAINIVGTFREQSMLHTSNLELIMQSTLYDKWKS